MNGNLEFRIVRESPKICRLSKKNIISSRLSTKTKHAHTQIKHFLLGKKVMGKKAHCGSSDNDKIASSALGQ